MGRRARERHNNCFDQFIQEESETIVGVLDESFLHDGREKQRGTE